MMDKIYTLDELDIILNSLENYTSRVNFIKRYINRIVYENNINDGNYKLFNTGLIKNANDEIIENEITGSTTFFTFPCNDEKDYTYTIFSSLENCISIRDIMNNLLLYI
jgi:hypothetical protein